MNVSLTPELEELVNEKVRSGLYHTASEVVREALRLLKQRDDEARRADQRAGLDGSSKERRSASGNARRRQPAARRDADRLGGRDRHERRNGWRGYTGRRR